VGEPPGPPYADGDGGAWVIKYMNVAVIYVYSTYCIAYYSKTLGKTLVRLEPRVACRMWCRVERTKTHTFALGIRGVLNWIYYKNINVNVVGGFSWKQYNINIYFTDNRDEADKIKIPETEEGDGAGGRRPDGGG